MKIAARRRLALGVLATSSALVAGVLIAPSSNAASGGLTIVPNGAVNTDADETLTFNTTEADLSFGGTAVFTRLDGPASFEVDIDGPLLPGTGADRSESADVDFTDVGDGVGGDGPADAGTYSVSVTGNESDAPVGPPGGGNDTCTSCFTVLPAGDVAIESVAPSSVRPGSGQNVSVLGNNFERGTKVEMLLPGTTTVDPGVNANNAPTRDNTNTGTPEEDGITTRTELRRRVVVAVGTEPGARDVRVTNFDITNGTGRSAVCSRCFFVAGAALTSIAPTTAFNDPTQPLTRITFNGTDVTDGTPRLDFVGNPGSASRSQLTVVGTNVSRNPDGSSITADFDLRNAAPGDNAYQPIVESEAGVVNACDTCRFTVIQRESRKPPTLSSLDRSTLAGTQNTIRQDETATFTATGTNFSKGVTLIFPGTTGAGLTITGVEFINPEQLEVTISAASNASQGDKDPQARLTDNEPDSTSEPCDNCLVVAPSEGASPAPSSSASPTPGNENFAFERFAGDDRYTTAARIATGSFPNANTVLLANGQSDDPRTSRNEDHFPDALAGAYLAGERKGPTLLTTENTLPQATRDALRSLGTENVVLLGGTSAISASQETELRNSGLTVTRIGGQNRYDTARRIAETPAVAYVGEDQNGDRTAVVASGEGFADALVAGPLGYAARFPVLITEKAGLSQPTREALQNLNIDQVLIPGGTAAVSQKTQDDIEALGITTRRFAGDSRTQTAALVADYAYNSLAFDKAHVDLARGDRFPDALAGGPHAGVRRAPIVLTATPNSISAATEEFLRRRGSSLMSGDIFGGTSAVSQSAEDQAERAVREGTSGGGEPSPQPSASGEPSADPSADPSAQPSAAPSADPSASAAPPVSPEPSVSASP